MLFRSIYCNGIPVFLFAKRFSSFSLSSNLNFSNVKDLKELSGIVSSVIKSNYKFLANDINIIDKYVSGNLSKEVEDYIKQYNADCTLLLAAIVLLQKENTQENIDNYNKSVNSILEKQVKYKELTDRLAVEYCESIKTKFENNEIDFNEAQALITVNKFSPELEAKYVEMFMTIAIEKSHEAEEQDVEEQIDESQTQEPEEEIVEEESVNETEQQTIEDNEGSLNNSSLPEQSLDQIIRGIQVNSSNQYGAEVTEAIDQFNALNEEKFEIEIIMQYDKTGLFDDDLKKYISNRGGLEYFYIKKNLNFNIDEIQTIHNEKGEEIGIFINILDMRKCINKFKYKMIQPEKENKNNNIKKDDEIKNNDDNNDKQNLESKSNNSTGFQNPIVQIYQKDLRLAL